MGMRRDIFKIRNRAKCKKCGDMIESKYRHNFVTCTCGAISVAGGNDYWKRSGNPENFEEIKEDMNDN